MAMTSSDPRDAHAKAPPSGRSVARTVPPSHPSDQNDKDKERNKRLRELRDEVQDLQAVLETVRKGETALQDLAGYIQRTKADVAALLADIPGADPVRHVCNLWEQISASSLIQNPEDTFDTQTQLHHLNMLDGLCKKLIFQVGVITIPERVNAWLRVARPGYYIPFHAVFEDELPDFDDRVKVLNYIAWAPRAIESGLVNAETGLIYRYSLDPERRWATFLGLIVAFVAVFALIAGVAHVPIQGWPLQQSHLATLLVGWVAVLAGVVVHIGIGAAKRAQAQGGRPPTIAVEDLFLWVNARFGHILFKMLLALVGFFGLVFAAGPDKVTPLNTFLVGYSLDSVVEIFSASLEQRATAYVAALRQHLGIEADA